MKTTTILLALMMIIIAYSSPAQINNDTLSTHLNYPELANQYFKKSHDQKVTSTVLGISGLVMIGTGVGLAAASLSGFLEPGAKQHDYGSAPEILAIGGGALFCVSIPYSFAYRKNKKRAGLYMNKEKVMITPSIKTTTQLLSMGIKINL